MWHMLEKREIGGIDPPSFAKSLKRRRFHSIELSTSKEIVSAHKSGVNSLQVDGTDARYLLAGASDSSVAVYDIEEATTYDYTFQTSKHESLFVVDKRNENGHRFCVSCVHWYPIDTGLFVTGSFDNFVNVWDTNAVQVELQFNLSKKVYAVSMSSIATTHMLIATGTEDTRVRLCDIASGAFTHTLTGHRDSVWTVHWSTTNEWILITGGCDGAIRFWDIRTTGCFQVLDQHRTQIGCRPTVPNGTSKETREQISRSGSSKSALGTQKGQKKPPSVQSDPKIAHYGSVVGLQMSLDGLYLISAGADSRLRMWDVQSGCNTLVNYPSIRAPGKKATQLAISADGSLVFAPSASSISVYDTWSGQPHSTLRGHYDLVNCCTFHPETQELYSGSNDRNILVWAPPPPLGGEELGKNTNDPLVLADEDAWSD